MITVGMIKHLLNHIPDDYLVDIDYPERLIVNYTLSSTVINDKTKNIITLKTINLVSLLSEIVYNHKKRNKILTVSEFIKLIKEDKNIFSTYLSVRENSCGNDESLFNIDENIKKMLVYKLQDGFNELKDIFNQIFEDEYSLDNWALMDKLNNKLLEIIRR